MTDTIDEIRARHEAVELALQTTGLRSQEAHADRATLLRLLSEGRQDVAKLLAMVDQMRAAK